MTNRYRFGDFELDLARRELRRDGEIIPLQPKIFAVLVLLVRNAGQALSKDDFLKQVWSGRFVTENVLSRSIRELRKVLHDDASKPAFIRTAHGYGYSFVAPVEAAAGGDERQFMPTRVAVLPFRPLVSGQSDADLELGLTDTLINDLTRLQALQVRPLAVVVDALTVKPSPDPQVMGKQLDVDVVIEGKLQVAGERVRLSVQATRVVNGSSLMAERFDEDMADLFKVQDDLSGSVRDALLVGLSLDAGAPGTHRQTRSVEAYQAYIEGRRKLAEHNVNAIEAALADFQHAVQLDAQYVEAHIGIAEANDLMATLGTEVGIFHERSRQAAERALSLDAKRARGYACLGKIAWQYDWNWTEAESWLRRSLALDPQDADTLIALSDFLCFQGRFEEALEVAERAGEINPFSPWIQALITQALYYCERIDEAIKQAERAVQLAPNFGFSQFYLGMSLFRNGQEAAGTEQVRQAIKHSGREDFNGVLGYMLARSGDEEAARALLLQLRESAARGDAVPPITFAILHTGLGEEAKALAYLRDALRRRNWHILLLHVDPIFAGLRARPDGLALLRELNLPTLPPA